MKKRVVTMALVFCMVLSMAAPAFAFEANDIRDDYWGREAIMYLSNMGIMNGFNGYFRPEDKITRVEFISLLNRSFGFTETGYSKSFKDVNNNDGWKAEEIKRASSQGYFIGSDGYANADKNITREEAFALTSRIMKFEKDSNSTTFADDNKISDWAKSDLSSIQNAGYVQGFNNQINPQGLLTRAEAAQLVYNAVGTLYNQEAEIDAKNEEYNNVTINTGGVTLKNAVIKGNLYITEGVGDKEVTLENVTVKGRALVSGGGINSIKARDSTIENLVINVPSNKTVRVEASGKTKITNTDVLSGAKLEEVNISAPGFENVTGLLKENSSLSLAGDFNKVLINSDDLSLELVKGSINDLISNGNNSIINLSSDAKVTVLTLNAAANVSGTGKILTANINSNNIVIAQTPVTVVIKDGVVAKINGKEMAKSESKPSNSGSTSGGGDYVETPVNAENFKNIVSPINNKEYSTEKFTAKPLVILMDFPNYRYTDLDTKEDWRINGFTGAESTSEFYESLFFGDDFYTTSDGKDHITVNKFFMEESGGTYELKGDIYGWYTAPKDIEYYGYNDPDYWDSDQQRSRELVEVAIEQLVENNPDIDLSQYDVEDKWDIDNDGNYDEPDGIVDTIVVIHAGLGEEWGGGSIGEDAIWPFRIGFSWYDYDINLDDPLDAVKLKQDDGTGNTPAHKFADAQGNTWFAEDFTVFEQDLPVDLFCHEYGHVLGLPDLYSAGTPPVENWSLMGGSYTGDPRGSEPNSFGALCKQWLQEDFEKRGRNANWQNSVVVDLENINENGMDVILDQASLKGDNKDAVIIKLPKREGNQIVEPFGQYSYFSDNNDNMENYMNLLNGIDLTNAAIPSSAVTSGAAISLSFDAWWNIDPGFDFFSVQAREKGTNDWITLNDTTNFSTDTVDQWILDNETPEQIKDRNPGWGITDNSNDEWKNVNYDLSQFTGKDIELRFRFRTDSNTPADGIYIDNVQIKNSDEILIIDDVESGLMFNLEGFLTSDGFEIPTDHYYVLEWRNSGANTLVDKGLQTINIGRPTLEYDPGLVVWYINEKYYGKKVDQNNYNHKNEQYAGIIDADQDPVLYKYQNKDSEGADKVNYQMHDAAFSLRTGSNIYIKGSSGENIWTIEDNNLFMNPSFSDANDYTAIKCEPNEWMGISLVEYGINIFVTDESSNRSTAKVHIALNQTGNAAAEQNEDVIKSITMGINQISVETDSRYKNTAYAEIVGSDGTIKQCTFNYANGKYVADADFLSQNNNWKIKYIVFEDKDGNAKAIYNSDVNGVYGVDFNSLIK